MYGSPQWVFSLTERNETVRIFIHHSQIRARKDEDIGLIDFPLQYIFDVWALRGGGGFLSFVLATAALGGGEEAE
jgi:hypothetical protein